MSAIHHVHIDNSEDERLEDLLRSSTKAINCAVPKSEEARPSREIKGYSMPIGLGVPSGLADYCRHADARRAEERKRIGWSRQDGRRYAASTTDGGTLTPCAAKR